MALIGAESPVSTPIRFGRHGNLVGLATEPREAAADRPFVLFITSGIIHRCGPNRLYVQVAEQLAHRGFPSLRFDLSGVGDSLIPTEAAGMSVQERAAADIDDALELVRTRWGRGRVVCIGLCSGADNALRTMVRRPEVMASVLLDLNTHRTAGFFLRHYSRRLFRGESWLNFISGRNSISRAVIARVTGRSTEPIRFHDDGIEWDAWLPRDALHDHLAAVADGGQRILAVFTGGVDYHFNHPRQLQELYPDLDFSEWMELHHWPDVDHTYSRVHYRERLIDLVLRWLEGLPD